MSPGTARSIVALAATAFLGYWSLLVYCEVVRPTAPGMSLMFDSGHAIVVDTAVDSPARMAGLLPGDRFVSIDSHAISGRLDMLAALANFAIDRPQRLTIDRGGTMAAMDITLTKATWDSWRVQDGPAILTIRIAQLVTLILAVVVALKRPLDATALVGAAFLATIGVFSVTLPFRFAGVWRELPPALGLLLWLPFMSSTVIGLWLYSFFAVFPAPRFRSWSAWLMLWLPVLPGLVSYGAWAYYVVVVGQPAPNLRFWPMLLIAVNVAYVVAGVVRLGQHYHLSSDANERRRVRVLVAGTGIGSLAGVPVVVAYWQATTLNLHRSFLESPASAAGAFLFLLMPLSFAYAILRHRLVDLGLMIRQGVRYALARRALLAFVPAIAIVLLLDLTAHGQDQVGDVLRSRSWVYAGLLALAVVARSQRQRWLDALDRRFFRERYNAQRVMRQVADDVRQADGLDIIAPSVVSRIEQALHPTFAALLIRQTETGHYRTLSAFPSGSGPSEFDGGNTVIGVAVLLRSPVEISGADHGWLARKVAPGEIERIRASGIDLLVPVLTRPDAADALLVLGPKRSEEPFTDDDGDLLMAIAESVALRMSRGSTSPEERLRFGECPTCGTCYDAGTSRCSAERALLVPVAAPRVIAGRYRIERRVGRGGMGTVYSAMDTALERLVAVKIVRPDLIGVAGAAERFQREARVAAAFAHPNVVTVHDFGIDGTTAFLVMEMLDGRTLHDAIFTDAPMPASAVLGVLKDVVAAVDAAHRRQVLHRDLKPENIYIDQRDGVEITKVLDFGIVKFLKGEATGSAHIGTGGALLGTPRYMAPEQLRGDRPTVSWDLWALAVISFEMLTGAHPFADGLATSTDGFAGALPVGTLTAFFTRALAIDPADRPSSAGRFLLDLEDSLLSHI